MSQWLWLSLDQHHEFWGMINVWKVYCLCFSTMVIYDLTERLERERKLGIRYLVRSAAFALARSWRQADRTIAWPYSWSTSWRSNYQVNFCTDNLVSVRTHNHHIKRLLFSWKLSGESVLASPTGVVGERSSLVLVRWPQESLSGSLLGNLVNRP